MHKFADDTKQAGELRGEEAFLKKIRSEGEIGGEE